MKKIIFAFLFFTCCIIQAQIVEPVKWKTRVEKLSEYQYNLIATATIDTGWHLYSQSVPDGGPIATSFIFNQIKTLGNVIEGNGKTINDPIFGMTIKFFEKTAVFQQKVEVKQRIGTITATVEFMACDDTRCLPPSEAELVFKIPVAATAEKKAVAEIEGKQESNTLIAEAAQTSYKDSVKAVSADKKDVVKLSEFAKGGSKSQKDTKDLWAVFFIAFLSGFAALLTPCVFPMIPMTVSFFTKRSKSKSQGIRNAVIYGISIIVIYLALGTVVTGIFGADALNALATNVWFNIIFFLILVFFAMSFLGAFEIVLPSSWANKVDSQADKGGLVGIFFMALALAIVSFSCTGPIVGTLLVDAASKGGIAPLIGMLGFSLAIALPFTLFAAFPGWLNSLPKSGGWLNTVKVVLGFLELALAFKFLSQADLVSQMHLLEREVFLAIWIVIFFTLALYLFGKITLPHDSLMSNISVGRLSLGMAVLVFTVYMIPGLWGAPLNLISAFPPPQQYSESPYGVGGSKQVENSETSSNLPDGAHLLAPYNIMAFDDYDKGLAYAKKEGKPIMIDFTGWACVNCRKMEQNVWPKPEVLEILKNKVVLISLYVDDKRELSSNEVVESILRPDKKLKYIGQKWSEMQTIRYNTNSQPFYVLMDTKENNLVDPVAYTPDVEEYLKWLNKGISKFK
ncbi:cytochrome c biogenesis protein CcdA [Flavobacterium sp. B11]|uniref:protein-disulfide reductase DsbD family protein n=1 Tax=Flavobacterium movens TaxID=214860 RepID=UPI0031D25935